MQQAPLKNCGTVEGALDLIRSNDVISTSIYGCEPTAFLRELHTIAPRVENVVLWSLNIIGPYKVMTDNSLKGRIDIYSFFYNGYCRAGQASGRFHMVPLNLHSVGPCIVATKRPTVFVAAVSLPDENGNVSISMDLESSWECMDVADRIIFEINPHLPRVCGETQVPLSRATYYYENPSPMPDVPAPPVTEEDRIIAGYVASLVHDGDCIQLGIGAMPNAVGEALMDKPDLGIHTEMLTASMGRLIRCGAVNNSRKNFNPGKAIAAFAWGDQALYELMRENPFFCMRRAAYVNDPFNIAKNDNLVSVNTAIQVDLTGQVCSESIGSLQFSGTGGATDFAYGAYHSKGGRGVIAFHSTAKNGTVSKILPQLTPGAVVSISRNLVDHVVTEYGIAKLRDRTVRQRVENLIAVAHPDFRGELRQQARKLLLL